MLDGSVAAGFELEPLIEGVSGDVTPVEKEDVRKLLLSSVTCFRRMSTTLGRPALVNMR